MAVVCYASTGSNTSPYETWAKAATSFAAALAASTAGDTVQVDMANIASGDAEIAADTTWLVPAGVTIHIGTQSGASGITTGIMGSTYWFGNSTASRIARIDCIGSCRLIGGITLRATTASTRLNLRTVGSLIADEVYMWHANTSDNAWFDIGSVETFTQINKLTLRSDDTAGSFAQFNGSGQIIVGYLLASFASAPVFGFIDSTNGELNLHVHGGDISGLGSGATLMGNMTANTAQAYLNNVILPASFVMLATQTNADLASGHLTLHDCSSSGSAVPFVYANACGEVRVDTGIYLTAGAAGYSAKITTTAKCSPANPFWTPWFNEYKTAATVNLSSEVLRDGSATAYTDAQFWKETLTKETTSSVVTTLTSTRGTGTNIPAGAGTGSWTGEGGTAWSGEITIDSVVLDVDGFVRQRFGAAVASSTIYVDIGPIT